MNYFRLLSMQLGLKTRELASEKVSPGGVITHIGLGEDLGGIDVRRITLQEVSFIGTYTYTAQDFKDTAKAIFDGRLGPLDWIERRPLSEGNRAFGEIRRESTLSKIVLAQMINKNRREICRIYRIF